MIVWVVMVAGHMTSPGWYNAWQHNDCVARAAEVGGACERLPDRPPKDTAEREQWLKTYCHFDGFIGNPRTNPCTADD